ncbi:unnamed protein product [Pocillopora meandrina]|uniref:Uncharacterized protein n=1 Tax=Pocillopora meandrina TaxID=46732 RepID=A0AAU9W7X6_9CNID|nr:unnamed protein product [Pocillopora meandrina]
MEVQIINDLSELGGADVIPRVQIMPLIMKFVCQPNLPKTNMCSVTELRWLLSKNKQAQSEVHYQFLLWNNDVVANLQTIGLS